MRVRSLLPSRSRPGRHRPVVSLVSVAFALTLILSGCSVSGNDPDPTPTPPPTEAPIPTLTADQVSVGDLIDRIDAAWPSVTTMRSTSWSGPANNSIGTPAPDQDATVEETVAPSSRRRVALTNGAPVDEQISINGVVYFKGASVVNAVAPFVGADTWVRVDPTIVPPDSVVGQQLAYLTRPLGPPYDSVSADLRARAATPSGTVTVAGRTCTNYTFVDTTSSGEKIDYALSLDDHDLPCSLVQSAGGFANTTIYEFNNPGIVITAPAGATPVSGTPEG